MDADLEIRLGLAEAACAARGARLTALRRSVLELLLRAAAPVGAYELLARLRDTRAGAAPPSVYRALDFLIEQGLVHRVERLGAFVSCVEPGHHHLPVHFLICNDCGAVRELEDVAIETSLFVAARREGFVPLRATVEIEGRCGPCSAKAA